MIPVAKISASFQLSGRGEGFTLSFDIVIIVPDSVNTRICYPDRRLAGLIRSNRGINDQIFDKAILSKFKQWSKSLQTKAKSEFWTKKRGSCKEKLPSLRIAIMRTIKGGKSNFHMRASSIKPNCFN